MHPIIPVITLEALPDSELLALYDALTLILDDPATAEDDRQNIEVSMRNISNVMCQRNLPRPSTWR